MEWFTRQATYVWDITFKWIRRKSTRYLFMDEAVLEEPLWGPKSSSLAWSGELGRCSSNRRAWSGWRRALVRRAEAEPRAECEGEGEDTTGWSHCASDPGDGLAYTQHSYDIDIDVMMTSYEWWVMMLHRSVSEIDSLSLNLHSVKWRQIFDTLKQLLGVFVIIRRPIV